MTEPISQSGRTAVLLLAHGTPDMLGEMADYLGKVTGGRAIPQDVVEELQHRYAQIGLRETPGPKAPPLTRWTFTQAHLLEQALCAAGCPLRVYAAMRNWHPFIAEVVAQIRADGVTRLIAVCLAPQNSRTSIGLYRRALVSALESVAAKDTDTPAAKIDLTFVEEWPEEPALIAAFAQRLVACCSATKPSVQGLDSEATKSGAGASGPASETSDLAPNPGAPSMAVSSPWVGSTNADAPPALPILFTAHSVPCRTIMTGEASIAGARPGTPMQATPDPYPIEAKRTAELVFQSAAAQLPSLKTWYFAFQSQGVAGGPWIGPTVEDTLKAIRAEGHAAVILQPIGFLCDHVEILYDIDIAFTETARTLGLRLHRPESLNDSPLLTQALISIVMANASPSQPDFSAR